MEAFDRIKKALANKHHYAEFLKCLNLFSHEVITKYGCTEEATHARANQRVAACE
jgi:histone deacetylase complex regulatory component SIN3